jgi:integrase
MCCQPRFKEDNMQGKRTRALDSRGRPVPGLYVRDGRYIAGAKIAGRWTMHTLDATTLTEAKRGRDSWLAGIREGRTAARNAITLADLFAEHQNARDLSDRTRQHEQHLLDRHLAALKSRRAQDITPSDVARLLRSMRDRYSPWTCVAVYRILKGSFALGVRRGVATRSPLDGLAPSEVPKQRNARDIDVLDDARIAQLVNAGASERWRAALALAGYAGLRLGEVRGLRWQDIDLDADLIHVRCSLLPDGTPKPPKTAAGMRPVPILPALRKLLVAWRLRSPHTRPTDVVICTAEGYPVQERNLRRALDAAKEAAGMEATDARLSWHSLRHAFASALATDLDVPSTTLARIVGHADAGFTLKLYAKDARDDAALAADVLDRAARAGVGR